MTKAIDIFFGVYVGNNCFSGWSSQEPAIILAADEDLAEKLEAVRNDIDEVIKLAHGHVSGKTLSSLTLFTRNPQPMVGHDSQYVSTAPAEMVIPSTVLKEAIIQTQLFVREINTPE